MSDSLSSAVNVADQVIGRAEINTTTYTCLLFLMEGGTVTVQLGGKNDA